ncbi:hypothetical protein GQ600_5245 [Phytophthora cactorum]|nr:hypothetical protein GQ600_5245 [Phytophthora cactorum]
MSDYAESRWQMCSSRTNCSVDCYMLALINILSVEFATRRSETNTSAQSLRDSCSGWLCGHALPTLYSDGGKRAWAANVRTRRVNDLERRPGSHPVSHSRDSANMPWTLSENLLDAEFDV